MRLFPKSKLHFLCATVMAFMPTGAMGQSYPDEGVAESTYSDSEEFGYEDSEYTEGFLEDSSPQEGALFDQSPEADQREQEITQDQDALEMDDAYQDEQVIDDEPFQAPIQNYSDELGMGGESETVPQQERLGSEREKGPATKYLESEGFTATPIKPRDERVEKQNTVPAKRSEFGKRLLNAPPKPHKRRTIQVTSKQMQIPGKVLGVISSSNPKASRVVYEVKSGVVQLLGPGQKVNSTHRVEYIHNRYMLLRSQNSFVKFYYHLQ